MGLVEELKHLIRIRNLFSSQLANIKSTQKRYHFGRVLSKTNIRIIFILDTLSLQDSRLKDHNIRELQETKSEWFNELSRNMLAAFSIEENADYSNLTEILYVFKDFLK